MNLEPAKHVLRTQVDGLIKLQHQLSTAAFTDACHCIAHCRGKIILMGVGKSGYIARKIAATWSSTGTPSYFIHPTEAAHGDWGFINATEDICIFFSNSGNNEELLALLPLMQAQKVKLITISSNHQSSLAQAADVYLPLPQHEEGCPLAMAPMTSATLMLALGHAIGATLMHHKNFSQDDFVARHPAGKLGKRLIKIEQIMHQKAAIPTIHKTASIRDAIIEMSQKGLGMVIITEHKKMMGVFTDGDIRRVLEQANFDLQHSTIEKVMSKTWHSRVANLPCFRRSAHHGATSN